MAINFPHSTRVLRNDGMVPTGVLLAMAVCILLLWGAWFVFARVPITITCTQAAPTRDGAVVAQCPPGMIGRVNRGASAVIVVTRNGNHQIFNAVVLRVPDHYIRDVAPDTVEVYPFLREPLPTGATTEVRVTVEEVSPLHLVLRGNSTSHTTISGVSRL
jgi:hypothetical protein